MTSRRARWATAWAKHGHPGKPPSRGAVAGWVASEARTDGTHAVAGAPWLASVSGVSERTVKRTVAALLAEGWLLLRERGHYRGPNLPPLANVYDLAVPTAHPDELLTSRSTGHLDGTLTGESTGHETESTGHPDGTPLFLTEQGAARDDTPADAVVAAPPNGTYLAARAALTRKARP